MPLIIPPPGRRRSAPRLFRTTFKYSGLIRSIRAHPDILSSQSTICKDSILTGQKQNSIDRALLAPLSSREFPSHLHEKSDFKWAFRSFSSNLFFHPWQRTLRSRLAEANGKIRALESELTEFDPDTSRVGECLERLDSIVSSIRPSEVTSEISFHCVDRPLLDFPLQLASILRAWRKVALSTPGLWTSFYVRRNHANGMDAEKLSKLVQSMTAVGKVPQLREAEIHRDSVSAVRISIPWTQLTILQLKHHVNNVRSSHAKVTLGFYPATSLKWAEAA
ncbi:hypothetical protein C8R44DRAFT_740093 [Mycena epipterygia]|nr:hypothetical protein C8R44DRAFT_740093 [Mycena epipterygia]